MVPVYTGVNHIGHPLLTQLLTKKLKSTAANSPDGARIVIVSSLADRGAPESGFVFEDWLPAKGMRSARYEDGVAYGQSKPANLMYATGLAHRLNCTGVSVYSCHPGVITSELSRYMEQEVSESSAKKGPVAKVLLKVFGVVFESAMFDVQGGALKQLHLVTARAETLENGGHYHPVRKAVTPLHRQAENETLRGLLWEETERAIRLRSNYKKKF
ncbi:hypothetical protein ACHAWF_002297 [Thalassiosira exigua]